LFAKEVLPEFHGYEAEHQKWKQAVLSGEIQLEEVDTEDFNFQKAAAKKAAAKAN
jgi:hypothetical protein